MSESRATGGAETTHAPAGELTPGVARGDRVHVFHAVGITVTWSRRRCTHVAECVMHLPAVFEPGRAPWVDATRDAPEAIARVVSRCPTGALHFERKDGGPPESVSPANSVIVSRDGPLHLRGDIEVLDDAGQAMLRDTRVALCRCGHSKSKPLCDNAHREVRFRDPGAIPDEDAVRDPGAAGSALRVIPHANASLELSGPFTMSSADRKTAQARTGARLCRCGQSQRKPFCDGSHERVGFLSG